jgi:hypothetical protein
MVFTGHDRVKTAWTVSDPARRRPDAVCAEDNVRVVIAVEEISRTQVRVSPGVLRVDGKSGASACPDGACMMPLCHIGSGAVPGRTVTSDGFEASLI